MSYAMIFARGEKDIPEWAKQHHDWEAATDVTKLKKLEVRMKLCCNSCIEKIGDRIRSMPGIFDFKTNKTDNLLTIYETPHGGPNHKQLLKKLKKVDKRAEILTGTSIEEKEKSDESANIVYYVMPQMMTPWNHSQSYSTWPFFTNFNYVQHRVCCGQCLGYADVVCSNCGRPSEVGALQE
ncbi:hypothetical protein KC19_9G065800 [Ceratodon purpureus]|uniref:HMA domain-containing protein n=1 Tax=Ceratodon purpureus TaxID=3225 RepID=A0A8T0GR94_CERPU|nr:hypothetical protein KC19_9G065800 [Ceratodon purpureus]